MDEALDRAAAAIRSGELVIYPTETVYGLGADALSEAAIERVFAAKRRPRDKPVSLAVPDAESALAYAEPTDRERRFIAEFLPGPATVLCRKRDAVPDALTAGNDRVGIRIPDHDLALALLERAAPITATSANVSGEPSATRPDEIDPDLREAVAAVLDGGETGGTGSTVVNVETGTIHRRGPNADAIEAWLAREE